MLGRGQGGLGPERATPGTGPPLPSHRPGPGHPPGQVLVLRRPPQRHCSICLLLIQRSPVILMGSRRGPAKAPEAPRRQLTAAPGSAARHPAGGPAAQRPGPGAHGGGGGGGEVADRLPSGATCRDLGKRRGRGEGGEGEAGDGRHGPEGEAVPGAGRTPCRRNSGRARLVGRGAGGKHLCPPRPPPSWRRSPEHNGTAEAGRTRLCSGSFLN